MFSNNYVLAYILSKCTENFTAEQICSKKLIALKKHDQEKETEYYKTLFVYFECRFNASAAAKKLFIDRSSFLSRIERIREIAKIDFESNK
ncbi:helix-turn-helix domain-containing protein [Dehalobacter sp. DCM]|uniref:PucR family transcriptional regulator n=1 Tax=Dehalobacter sp. DCM TaxID=2907827 RepID=UPI003081D0CE|nr:helix-turn-helix domain-containing protein [Dehalobacter sp. DCM]